MPRGRRHDLQRAVVAAVEQVRAERFSGDRLGGFCEPARGPHEPRRARLRARPQQHALWGRSERRQVAPPGAGALVGEGLQARDGVAHDIREQRVLGADRRVAALRHTGHIDPVEIAPYRMPERSYEHPAAERTHTRKRPVKLLNKRSAEPLERRRRQVDRIQVADSIERVAYGQRCSALVRVRSRPDAGTAVTSGQRLQPRHEIAPGRARFCW